MGGDWLDAHIRRAAHLMRLMGGSLLLAWVLFATDTVFRRLAFGAIFEPETLA
jgi:hypothetical protein